MESIKCPGCGATLTYNLEDEELKCDYCGNICIIREDQITDAEYIKNRLMDVHATNCPGCGARLMTNINTTSSSCAYCGSSIIYDEKVNKVFKPKKIILFEIGLDEVKERVKKYFDGSDFASKNDILSILKPIYLPYWLYRCTYQSEDQKVECNDILADASSKIDDSLADKIDKSFDLSKLQDFDISNITGFYAEEYDVTFKGMNRRINKKIEEKVGTPVDDNCISNAKSMYIQLPVYYGEINGLKILVNGQNGTIAINSEQYLKTAEQIRKDLKIQKIKEKFNPEVIKNLLKCLIAFIILGVIVYLWCKDVGVGEVIVDILWRCIWKSL
jgi:predicted RNA-binding Zn-ribbon protein involved in translation (DUF1610 family)